MVSSLEVGLNGFEVQRKMGMLKSATMAKVRFGEWWFFDMVRLSDGCCCWDDEFVTEHKLRDMEFVFHCEIGGRF